MIRMAVKQKPASKTFVPAVIRNLERIPGRNIFQKDIEELKREVKNYNQRMRYQVNKAFKDKEGNWLPGYGEKTFAEKYEILSQKQYIPPFIRVDFSKVRGQKDMDKLFDMLRKDTTGGFKARREIETGMWMEAMVKHSLNIEEDDDPELFNKIKSMSSFEIMQWSLENAKLVGDTFNKYDYVWQGITGDKGDAQERKDLWNDIRTSLGLEKVEWKAGEIPRVSLGGM